MDERYSEALMTAKNSNQALKALFELRKSTDAGFSLATLVIELGVLSKGHLSQIMSEKKPLSKKHLASLQASFSLNETQREYLATLIDIDKELDPVEMERLLQKKAILNKTMLTKVRDLPQSDLNYYFGLEVFSAFSLFSSPPTLDDFMKIFGTERRNELFTTLDHLISAGVVASEDGRYIKLCPIMRFEMQQGKLDYLKFMEESLDILRRPDCQGTALQTYTISIKRSEYEKLRHRICKAISDIVSELETNDADTLIRFNSQVFPVYALKD